MSRKPKKYHYIYKTTCSITKRYYYGMHSSYELNDGYLGSGSNLGKSLRKYGKENHYKEIIEYLEDRASLKKREGEIVNEIMLADPLCMNLSKGGGGSDYTLGLVSVKDKDGNTMSVSVNDTRYLNGELIGVNKNTVQVKDINNNIIKVFINDPRYLNGELIHMFKHMVTVKDKNGNTFNISKNDIRFLLKELNGVTKGMVTVKDKNGNTESISINDPRYLSGELIPIWLGKTHSIETKQKMSISQQGKQKGNNNSQYGTCWITNGLENRKIHKGDNIPNGFKLGRIIHK